MITMKKLIPLFLCLVLAVGLLPLIASPAAAVVYNDGDWQFTAEGSEATIIAYKGSASSVTIPATLETAITCTVKAIDKAFYKNTTVTSVTFASGSTVTTIDNGAFEDCTNLTSITFPSTLKVIGYNAFSGCSKLASASIPNGVTTIGMQAFSGTALKTVLIPESVTSIGEQAFAVCTEMTKLQIFADGLTEFGSGAFSNCWKLTSVVIPDGITSLSDFLFDGCSTLESITIPDTVASIGRFAFRDCTSLTMVLYKGYVDDWNAIDIDSNGNSCLTNARIDCVPQTYHFGDWEYTVSAATGEATLSGYTGSDTMLTIPEKIKDVYVTRLWETFKGNENIVSVAIPDGLQKIGYEVFSGCTKLMDVTIPDSVTVIGTSAFEDCYGLMSITIPDSVTRIETRAFCNSSLTALNIPVNVSYIGDQAFLACEDMAIVSIPNSVHHIAEEAFTYCNKLAKVNYSGTIDEWNAITIKTGNDCLTNAAFFCIPEAPVLQTPKPSAGGMELNWNAVPGTAQYRVYRRDNEKGSWSGWGAVATGLKKTSWTDPNVTVGKQYKYKVRAYGTAWSGDSNAESVTMTVYVPAPELTVTAGGGKASLSWTNVLGASQYRVYRRDNEKGTWSGWSAVAKSVKGTSWDDTSVIPGKQYKYEVRAYAGGNWSDYSNPETVKIPIAPVLTVTANAGANSLSWTAISGATQYRVYRRDNESGSWTGWSMVKRLTGGTSWDDTDIISGKSYKYQVRAYAGGAWTDYSNAVTVKAK